MTDTAELASYRALELGTPQGRVSAKCEDAAHPVWLRELDDVRGCPWCRVAEMERDAEASPPPAVVLVKVAMALREQPTGARLLDGLDELGELVVCDGEPADIASMVAALRYLIGCDTPAPDADE